LADPDDPADAAARLEQALERIAALSLRPAPSGAAVAPFDAAEVSARLDALILRIRTTLDTPSEG
jgi:hypothetical protein